MKPHWTPDVPTNSGWYWWKPSGPGVRPAVVVHIFYDGHNRVMRVDTVTGREPESGLWWSKPIKEPTPTAHGGTA